MTWLVTSSSPAQRVMSRHLCDSSSWNGGRPGSPKAPGVTRSQDVIEGLAELVWLSRIVEVASTTMRPTLLVSVARPSFVRPTSWLTQ